jgi:D-threo-aldose 1-dehydrogenase
MSIEVSRLGFGLSSIAGSGNFKHQQNLIRTAIDCGVTHFDVAPYYGSGDAEVILGKILKTCPDPVTVTTKFGLTPFSTGKGGSMLRTVLRPVFRRINILKSLASSILSKAHDPQPTMAFNSTAMFQSVERSIENIQRPISFFLLHDASVKVANDSEVIDALNKICGEKKVGFTGISGNLEVLKEVVSSFPKTYAVAQLENSILNPVPVKDLYDSGAKVFTHRAIQGGLSYLTSLINQRPGFSRILQRELDVDVNQKERLPLLLIELALNENPKGTVLFSSTRPDRVKQISGVLSSPMLGAAGCVKLKSLLSDVEPVIEHS